MTEQRAQKSSPFLESFGLLQILFHLQTLDGAIEGCFGANDVDIAFASVSEALFSAHAMTDAQRDAMKKYVRTVLDACRHRWSFGQKLVYRWIECLYL